MNKVLKIVVILTCITMVIFLGVFAYNSFKFRGIMMGWQKTSISDFHAPEYREHIVAATFVETKEVPNQAIKEWDVSLKKDKSVIAYIVPDSIDSSKYHLYIGANGKVVASESLSHIFHNFPVLTRVDMASLDASNVTIMWQSFSSSPSLVSVSLPRNTDKLENINAIFSGCHSLESARLDVMNLENVDDIGYAFSGCKNLKNIDFGTFDARKLKDASYAFSGCNQLTNLDISSFNPQMLEKASHMFNWSNRLETLDISQLSFVNVTDGASAIFNKMPNNATVYVKDEQTKQWILSLKEEDRPTWNEKNIIVK